MKVNVTQMHKHSVPVSSLEPGEGFMFDRKPHIVVSFFVPSNMQRDSVMAFNLETFKVVQIPLDEYVYLVSIAVYYSS